MAVEAKRELPATATFPALAGSPITAASVELVVVAQTNCLIGVPGVVSVHGKNGFIVIQAVPTVFA